MKIVTFLTLTLVGLSSADICPPSEVLAPCECNDYWKTIECSDIDESVNLKEIFANASAHVDKFAIFHHLYISSTELTEIEEGTIEHMKFFMIDINFNKKLEYISPRAFKATKLVTQSLELRYNDFKNDTIFEFINGFPALKWLDFSNNHLSSIPPNALQRNLILQEATFEHNQISQIGNNAFPLVGNVLLAYNRISPEGLHQEAFSGIGSTRLDLSWNDQVDLLEQDKFQVVLDRAYEVVVGGHNCSGFPPICDYQKLKCDERADWICDQEEEYRPKLKGFVCVGGEGPENDVWDYCARRN